MGTLDQGYWPDGIYTAPTDAALRFDLEQQKALGFNTVRKHIKVEPARWFYHCDRLGLLVYQDMPAMRTGFTPSTADRTVFEDELRRMIDQLRGITSIVQWIPFNEGWGEYDEARIADLTKSFDSTRPINGNSGSNCCGRDPGNGDIIDGAYCSDPRQKESTSKCSFPRAHFTRSYLRRSWPDTEAKYHSLRSARRVWWHRSEGFWSRMAGWWRIQLRGRSRRPHVQPPLCRSIRDSSGSRVGSWSLR